MPLRSTNLLRTIFEIEIFSISDFIFYSQIVFEHIETIYFFCFSVFVDNLSVSTRKFRFREQCNQRLNNLVSNIIFFKFFRINSIVCFLSIQIPDCYSTIVNRHFLLVKNTEYSISAVYFLQNISIFSLSVFSRLINSFDICRDSDCLQKILSVIIEFAVTDLFFLTIIAIYIALILKSFVSKIQNNLLYRKFDYLFKEIIETAKKFFSKNKYIFVAESAFESISQKKSIFVIYLNFVTLISALTITIKNNSISTAIINSIFQISFTCSINSIVFIDLTVKRSELLVKLLFFQQTDFFFIVCLRFSWNCSVSRTKYLYIILNTCSNLKRE